MRGCATSVRTRCGNPLSRKATLGKSAHQVNDIDWKTRGEVVYCTSICEHNNHPLHPTYLNSQIWSYQNTSSYSVQLSKRSPPGTESTPLPIGRFSSYTQYNTYPWIYPNNQYWDTPGTWTIHYLLVPFPPRFLSWWMRVLLTTRITNYRSLPWDVSTCLLLGVSYLISGYRPPNRPILIIFSIFFNPL